MVTPLLNLSEVRGVLEITSQQGVAANSRAGATLDLRSRACTDLLSSSTKDLLGLHKSVQT